MKKLVIVGDTAFAEIAQQYFDQDSPYTVVSFAVERSFLKQDSLNGLPIVALEDLESTYGKDDHEVFVAITYIQLNRVRERISADLRRRGYRLASYISSRAFVWKNVKLGEHCFVFENNTLQPFTQIGNNVVIWSGNHVGHHSVIEDHCFISSHVVISGYCVIGAHTFLGVNSTVANNVTIGRDNWVGPSVTILKTTADGSLFAGTQPEPSRVSALKLFKVKS